jgi:hypothetical protein
MKALSALHLVLAATVTVTACSGPGPADHGKPRTALRSDRAVTSIIQQVGQLGGRLVLAVPPAHLEQTAPTAPGHGPTSYAATGRWFGP